MSFKHSLQKTLTLLSEPDLRFEDFLKLQYARALKREVSVHPRSLKHPVKINSKIEFKMMHSICLKKSYSFGKIRWTPETIIDAGANVGFAAVYFASRFPNASICAVEPEKNNFERLSENCAPFQNITCVHGALTDRVKKLSLYNDEGRIDSFKVLSSSESSGEHLLQGYSIPALLEKMGWSRIGLLKMDIEGSESEVFGNSFEDWINLVDMFAIEVHDTAENQCTKSVFRALEKIDVGYALRPRGENLFIERIDIKNLRDKKHEG